MPKILAIDDKQDNLITLSAILKNLIPECHVITAQSGPEGLEMAKIHSPDTILLDIKMPGMDGYEVCKRLKEDEDTQPIPVILISAVMKESKDFVKGLDCGADAYLTKPIDELVLAAQIKTALRLKAAEDYLRMQKGLLEDMVQKRTAELVQTNKQLNHEINKRKLAENALRESEAFLKMLIDAIPTPVFYKDRDGKYIGFNRAFETFFGKTKEQLIGKSVFDINPPELAEIYRAKDEELFNSGGVQRYESQWKNAHGELRDFIFNKAVFTDSKGAVVGLIGALIDITERKQVEEKLRKSEMLHRQAQRVAKIGHWELDSPSGTPLWSEEIFHIFGLDPMVSTPSFASHVNLIHDEHWGLLENSIQELNINGTPFDIEFRILRSDGETRWMHARGSADKGEDGSVTRMFGTAQDITDRKKAEEEHIKLLGQLQQAQKMEAMGALAGGIAHDFNNILFPIVVYTEMLIDEAAEERTTHESLSLILKSAMRARDLVQQILTFSRQQEQKLKPLKAEIIVKEALKLLRSSLPSTIEIDLDVADECGMVLADPTNIHQIIMNLCTNAYHAMQKTGGRLGVTLSRVEQIPEDVVGMQLKPGPYLYLKVEDTGHGMEKEVMDRIFEPYYTTKDVGKGTGMGLALVQGIVHDYGGEIRVQSKMGVGTVFQLFLPSIKAETPLLETEPALDIPKGNETILIVDDEESITKLEEEMLRKLGYEVTTCASSSEALLVFRRNPEAFDLVITDMTMPHMTGDEMALKMMKVRPDIPIVLCTGHSEQITEKEALALGIRGFLLKPIQRRILAEKIREVLDERILSYKCE